MARLRDRRTDTGFLRQDGNPYGEPDPEPWGFDRGLAKLGENKRSRTVTVTHDGAAHVATLLVGHNDSDYEYGSAQVYNCVVQDVAGKVVAYANGVLVISRDIFHPLEFVNCSDCVNDDALRCADGLLQQASAPELFEAGAVLMVTMWERSSHALPGLGLVALDALAALMRKRRTRVGTLCILLDAFQYSDLHPNVNLADEGFRSSVAKVRDHLTRARPEVAFGPAATLRFVEPVAMSDGDNGLGTLRKHAVAVGAYGPKHTGGTRIRPQDEAEVWRIDPGEPAIADGWQDYPEDFNAVEAAGTLAFGPHRSFWDLMPTEMASLDGTYGDDGKEGAPTLASLRVGFVNGSVLDLDPAHLPGGDKSDVIPKAFVGADDLVVRRNAYTERMGTLALARLLTAHLLLAFAGLERAPDARDFRVSRSLRQ